MHKQTAEFFEDILAVKQNLDRRAALYAQKRYGLLSGMERRLDILFLGLFATAILFDGVMTGVLCPAPKFELNSLARTYMYAYGIPAGVILAVFTLSLVIVMISYTLFQFSDWYLKRADIDFPGIRKFGTYLFLLVLSLKHISGALSWWQPF